MQIPKDKILEMLHQQGNGEKTDQAKQQLPDQVDLDQHSDLLQKFGINPQDVLSKLGGDIPGLKAPEEFQQRSAEPQSSRFTNQ